MKKEYQAPRLMEYGPIDRLTLGVWGTQPDNTMIFGLKISNNSCNPNLPLQQCGSGSVS